MAKRPTRLRFTEDDLTDSHVKKAADRADKAVDKAEKAADKLASKKVKPKLKLETDAAGSRKAKLRFEKAEFTEIERPSVAKHMASRGAAVTLTSKAHQAVSEYEDDNIGVQVVQETTKAVESTAYTVDHAVYSHKLKAYDKAEKLVEKSDKANVNALYEKFKKDNPDAASKEECRLSAKLDRIGADLEKARKKRAEWDAKVKDLERRYREEENSEIHEMVHAANLNPEQLSELLRMFAADMAPKPDTINTMNEEETQNEI